MTEDFGFAAAVAAVAAAVVAHRPRATIVMTRLASNSEYRYPRRPSDSLVRIELASVTSYRNTHPIQIKLHIR